jgi:hypothetical protein
VQAVVGYQAATITGNQRQADLGSDLVPLVGEACGSIAQTGQRG